MCGRFTLKTPTKQIADLFDLAEPPPLVPRFNIAPTQSIATIRLDNAHNQREFLMMRWGLIPAWAPDAKIGNRLLNARSETVAEKPSFRSAFKHRRCLVLADGFYEWQKNPEGKQPFYIRMRDDHPFAFAGLWERWIGPDSNAIESCALLTTTANEVMSPIHERMPVILLPEANPAWLDTETSDSKELLPFLVPYPQNDLVAYPVGKMVNSSRNEDPRCVEPAGNDLLS